MGDTQKSILLVEDEPLLLELYTTILTSEGYRVAQALNGVDALHAMKENTYDLVLLDIMMPRLDGLGVLAALGTSEVRKQTILMLSNLDQESMIKRALALGAKAYLVKSDFTPDQMLEAVQKFLSP